MAPPKDPKATHVETPLIKSAPLSKVAGCNVFLKLENTQPSGSFKSRGIGTYMKAKIETLPPAHGPIHFFSSSGGNAGLACVVAAVTLGHEATVVVPLTTSSEIFEKLVLNGASHVQRHGASWKEADDFLTETVIPAAQALGVAAIYVPPFDAPEIWDGNATLVHEITAQMPDCRGSDLEDKDAPKKKHPCFDAIVCSVGGGGLLCGVVNGMRATGMDKERSYVLAVETEGADSLAQAVSAKKLVTLPKITSLATSLGARTVCQRALIYGVKSSVKEVVLPDKEAILACRRFLNDHNMLVELACGVVIALCYGNRLKDILPGFSKDSVVVLVVCGGSNISLDMLENFESMVSRP